MFSRNEAGVSSFAPCCYAKKGDPLKDRPGIKRGTGNPYSGLPVPHVDQVQVIRPVDDEAQVFVVSECVAPAVQLAGGPAVDVAVTVTFCEATKPFTAVVPLATPLK